MKKRKEMEELFKRMMTNPTVTPTPAVVEQYTNKGFLLQHHAAAVQQNRNLQIPNKFVLQHTVATELLTASQVALTEKNQLCIQELTRSPNKVSTGKFLLCRTISPPLKMTALATIIDDPEGKLAAILTLYNFVPDISGCTTENALQFLPVGTILAIKNPWFKSTADGGVAVRCDNPHDVVIMNEDSLQKLYPGKKLQWNGEIPSAYLPKQKQPPTVHTTQSTVDWKMIGNEYYDSKNYKEAIFAYSKGLKCGTSVSVVEEINLLSNRSAAYLGFGKFDLALKDAQTVLVKTDGSHIKCIARKTKALWGLSEYQGALHFLDETERKKVKLSEADKRIFDNLLVKGNALLRQNKFGEYDWKEIEELSKRSKVQEALSFAEFHLEGLTVKKSGKKGRGLFTSKLIKAGDLIMASKAFQFVYQQRANNKGQSMMFSMNLKTKLVSDQAQAQLVTNVTHFLSENPEKGREFYQLYAGPELSYLDPAVDDCSVVDMKRIDQICTFNQFGFGSHVKIEERLCGVWILPSYVNHSCSDSNCIFAMAGDFLFLRAFKDIAAEEEILINYQTPLATYDERAESLKKYGFKCNCTICKRDKQESPKLQAERAKFAKELNSGNPLPDNLPNLHQLLVSLEKFEKVGKNTPELNFNLGQPLHRLGVWYFERGDFLKGAEITEKAFNMMNGTPMCEEAVSCCSTIILCRLRLNHMKKVRAWAKILKNLTMVVYGSADVLEVRDELSGAARALEQMGIQI